MSLELYAAFVAATAVLMLIPGPNVALIVANSVAHGSRFGILTVAGTSSAMVVQLGLTVLGATAALGLLAESFDWLRWLGVVYLLYLGVRTWCAPTADLASTPPQGRSARRIFVSGFAVSLTNPKTLLFYGAFLPQFVTPGANATDQLLVLATTFIAIAILLDGTWALLAGRLRGVLSLRGRLHNRLIGGLLIGASVGLALAREP